MAKAHKPADPPSIKDSFLHQHVLTNLKGVEVIKYFSKNKDRYLTFGEIFCEEKRYDSNLWVNLNKSGIYACKPSEQEIIEYAKEILKIFQNEYLETEKEKIRQKQFWSLYIKSGVNKENFQFTSPENIYLKMSPNFLLNNEWMLE